MQRLPGESRQGRGVLTFPLASLKSLDLATRASEMCAESRDLYKCGVEISVHKNRTLLWPQPITMDYGYIKPLLKKWHLHQKPLSLGVHLSDKGPRAF